MSLLKDYSISYDKSGNYTVNFTTTEKASATYSIDVDGTKVITLDTDARGATTFSHDYGNSSTDLKFNFDQPDPAGRRKKPKGLLEG